VTAGGWTLLILSCGSVTALVLFCFWRVMRIPRPTEEIHAPLDIETGERDRNS
jgi:hypothetical protein